ncbi:Trans-2,3-dihydro-3-hydroxyanthranilate isomerase [Paraburkholderia domus]|jgi:phenazine biosynthesis protein PhzF family|uniref:Trans-2,3-dihydro-3-hydroxyanthranilate isomerase n=1 Tax=Paraburkholderia domus TaxID=2793075 RepID=A0A9N8QZU4_9BURK|nr:PhzF family phenazine biosynthesis protein [Paraburkholderia domus]MBK5049414.1 PhzF family phenazine biosynthesis protein [Burkholderia sp. R-70006]MBK5062022.1 PhzF family phenazine biosynthesis protein [Burkholderia sp. R-70199]MBK5087275.1 PhzF family phenazine biosynthesis protein [Burkholderia sp. R-69927]MBK5124202.1 PhzF family phenazine biosynthesis protein [Burkholderia sp. R-69980]MBK5166863.1 PhzF family phenazine biosynthesis protein [Burkholderia sp. R-70211]MBK5180790.1 PhzF
MSTYTFRLLNVFAESTFGGNPLCVFEDARGMDDLTMLALAAQFNLSETTFVLPSDRASAQVRIFTPGYEMPFAGHPALGTAHVVRDVVRTGDSLTLEFKAGVIPVSAHEDVWTFAAPHAGKPKTAACTLTDREIASLLGLNEDDLLTSPIWVNTGSDQLLVALNSTDAVRRARPDSARLDIWPQSSLGRKTAYVFAFDSARPGRVLSRYFFAKQSGGISEDPGTGSACANLGGWLLANGEKLPAAFEIEQGEAVGRPSLLRLSVIESGEIHVGGRVIEIGRGAITL